MNHVKFWGALFALALVAPYAIAVTAPTVETDAQVSVILPEDAPAAPPSGLGATDPWIDANGDAMFGDLDMQLNGILLNGQRFESPGADQLRFNGKNLCVQGGGICGGTVTSVGTGAGLAGGPITTAGTISIASGGVSNAMLANGAVTAAKIGEACASGQILKRGATAWACGADADTTYGAGSGLALSGTTFSIPTGAVTSAMVQDGGIATADLASGAVSSAKLAASAVGTAALADGAVTSAKIQDGGIGSADLAASSVGSAQLQQDSVGMREIAVPAGGGTAFGPALVTSAHNYLFAGSAFTPAVSGSCLVSASGQILSSGANPTTGPYFRIAIKRGTENWDDFSYGQYFPAMSTGGYSAAMSRTMLVPVTAGELTQFGGYFGFPDAVWGGDSTTVVVSYVCF